MHVGKSRFCPVRDHGIVLVVELPASARIDGSVRVRYLRMTARGRDGSAGGKPVNRSVIRRRRTAYPFHRGRHLEGGFVGSENEPLLVNLVVGGDFLVRQLTTVEADAVDGTQKTRGIGSPFADDGRRSGRAPVVTA